MTTYAQPTYPVSSSNEGLVGKWTDIFRSDILVHVGIMGSIIAGTFQAYLKDRIAGPIPYALSDGAFILAVAAWFGSIAIRRDPIRGPGATPIFIVAIILVPAFYLLYPGTPILVRLAGLRGWSMFPVAGLMALTVIRNAAQLRAYIGLVLILCTITVTNHGPDDATSVKIFDTVTVEGTCVNHPPPPPPPPTLVPLSPPVLSPTPAATPKPAGCSFI